MDDTVSTGIKYNLATQDRKRAAGGKRAKKTKKAKHVKKSKHAKKTLRKIKSKTKKH